MSSSKSVADCYVCGCKLDSETVNYCGGVCETEYCEDCLFGREYYWCCEECENYSGSECQNCGHLLSAEELAEGQECCTNPKHIPSD